MIKRYLPEIGISLPLKNEDDVDSLSDFFYDMEVSLANASSYGDKIDHDLLICAAEAYDELSIVEEDDCHDIDELNRRLMS